MSSTLSTGSAASPKRIFIVDDHPVFRKGLAQLISEEEGLEVCGSAGTVAEALKAMQRLKPDLTLVDVTMPGKSGLDLIKAVRAKDRSMKLLVVSMHDEALYANRVLRLGADGYIMKQECPHEIVSAIRDVLEGHIYVSERVMAGAEHATASAPHTKRSACPLDQLNDSELQILELLGQGQTNEEIADQLHLTAVVVKSGCDQIRKKLQLKSDNALIRYAVCWVETGRT